MNILKKTYCRIYQFVFRLAHPFLPYREPKILESTDDILKEIAVLGIDSLLLITDEFLRSAGHTAKLEKSFENMGIKYAVYDKTRPNPTSENVEEALELYKENNAKCLIAVGGGSSIDCAKAVGARKVYPEKTLNQLGGNLKIFRKLPILFAVPTTAGTGSEATLTAVVTDEKTKHKYTMNSFPLIPRYAVLDPKMTFSLPKHLTATTGIDALTHAVEAYIGQSATDETRKLSKEAVRLIFENIETAYNDAENEKARKNMLVASYKAGIAFSKSYVGYVHAVAHSLGGQYNIAHGLANSVLLPIVLEEYGECIYKKLYELALEMKIADKEDTVKIGAEKFIKAIKDLNERLGIPKKLEGIKTEDISKIAKYADKEANPLYPVPRLMNAKELEMFYYKVAGENK